MLFRSLIILTDMSIDFPDEEDQPPYPVLWVTENDNVEPPFGIVVVWNPDEKTVEHVKCA